MRKLWALVAFACAALFIAIGPHPSSAALTCGVIGDSETVGVGSPDGATWWGGKSGLFTGALYSSQVGCTTVHENAAQGKSIANMWQPSSVSTPSSQAYVTWAKPIAPCGEAFVALGVNDAPIVGDAMQYPATYATPAPSSTSGFYEDNNVFEANYKLLINAIEDSCDSAHYGAHTSGTAIPIYLIVPMEEYYLNPQSGTSFESGLGSFAVRSEIFDLIGLTSQQALPTWTGYTYTNLSSVTCPSSWAASSSLYSGTYNGGTGYNGLTNIYVIDMGCDPAFYESDHLTRWPTNQAATNGIVYFCYTIHPCDAGYQEWAADVESAISGGTVTPGPTASPTATPTPGPTPTATPTGGPTPTPAPSDLHGGGMW